MLLLSLLLNYHIQMRFHLDEAGGVVLGYDSLDKIWHPSSHWNTRMSDRREGKRVGRSEKGMRERRGGEEGGEGRERGIYHPCHKGAGLCMNDHLSAPVHSRYNVSALSLIDYDPPTREVRKWEVRDEKAKGYKKKREGRASNTTNALACLLLRISSSFTEWVIMSTFWIFAEFSSIHVSRLSFAVLGSGISTPSRSYTYVWPRNTNSRRDMKRVGGWNKH